jgi:hypothetical protein
MDKVGATIGRPQNNISKIEGKTMNVKLIKLTKEYLQTTTEKPYKDIG